MLDMKAKSHDGKYKEKDEDNYSDYGVLAAKIGICAISDIASKPFKMISKKMTMVSNRISVMVSLLIV